MRDFSLGNNGRRSSKEVHDIKTHFAALIVVNFSQRVASTLETYFQRSLSEFFLNSNSHQEAATFVESCLLSPKSRMRDVAHDLV